MEREISLKDLEIRYPDVAEDVKKVVFEEPAPPKPKARLAVTKIVRDVGTGLVVAIIMIWIAPFL